MLVIHINRQRIRHISGCNICEVLLDVPALRSWFPCSIELHMTIYGNCVCLFLSVANRMNILTGAAYLKEEELKGFDNYKYRCRDTSPYSIYIVNPCWNKMVEFLPRWVSPNLMTMVGFLLTLSTFLLISWYDYDFKNKGDVPSWVWLYSSVAHITGYNLDGMDGKQARRTKTSTPLGELFDHGLDSLVASLLPLTAASVLGLEVLTEGAIFFMVIIGVVGFYVTHWEKYNTGVLFLPWIYDFIHQGISLVYLLNGLYGVSLWTTLEKFSNEKVISLTLMTMLVVGMTGGTVISILISSWNVIVSYVNNEHKQKNLSDSISPLIPLTCLVSTFVVWGVISPNRILNAELRCFCLTFGIVSSNIMCNLIITQMSGLSFRIYNSLVLLSFVCVTISVLLPQLEITVLYAYLLVAMLAHFNFGFVVVKELSSHFKIDCFRIPYEEKNS